jgi:hypothetical protein
MPRCVCTLLMVLVGSLVLAAPASVCAQQSPQQAEPPAQPARKAKKPRARQPEPQLDEEDQLSPRQLDQRPAARPARQPEPARAEPPASAQPPAAALPPELPAAAKAAVPPRVAEPARVITCSAPFGKEASHLKLAQRFDSRNITYTEVDGPDGSKMRASVLYPNDPKRRLELVWQNEASRSVTHLIVINGQSTWAGPKGVRLGLTLAALEKINGKPFKMSGFDQPDGGSVTDWQGGALDSLPGCRMGLRLAADAKAPEAARSEAAGKELMSSDAPIKAVKPVVAEILFGF